MSTEQIISIVVYAIGAAWTLINIALFIRKRVKGSNNDFMTDFVNFLQEIGASVRFAEQMAKLTGDEKKTFASRYLAMYCENRKVKAIPTQLDTVIETIINITKAVNVDGKYLTKDKSDELIGDNTADCIGAETIQTIANNDEVIQ